ncbi:hypothetical protein ACVWYQ_003537 [Bradyrhizobium sp. USDA 3397]
MDEEADAWFDRELAGCSLADERLNKRRRKLVAQIGSAMGESIPLVCQDWANTKAAYRFFSIDRVSEADILAGHFQSTRERTIATGGPVLVLHDTTEFSYQRENSDAIGITKSINSGQDKADRLRSHTVCGILMHSSVAVTTEGLPLGLTAVKFWTRKKFKGTAALKKKINPTRVPSRRRRAFGGWIMSGNPRSCWAIGGDAFISVIATSMSCSARLEKLERISRLGLAFDRLAGMEITRSPTKWTRSPSKDCIASTSETTTAIRRGHSRDPISQDSHPAADRKAEALSRADLDGDPCRRARDAEEKKETRVEADHRSACWLPHRPLRSLDGML